MNRNLIILFGAFFILIVSCNSNDKKIIIEFNESLINNGLEKVLINIDSLSSFGLFQKRLQDIACEKKIPVISFEINDTIKKIYSNEFCLDGGIGGLYKARNNIEIIDDSIYKNEISFKMDRLCNVLKKDLLNNANDSLYSDSSDKLVINIAYKNKELEQLKYLLNEITNCYNKLEIESELNLRFVEVVFPKLIDESVNENKNAPQQRL